MIKVIGVITARVSSERLPGKVMKDVAGKSVFAHHVERLKNVKGLDGVFLATSRDPLNKKLIKDAERLECGWYAGAEEDVVERHIKLCEREAADAVIRVPCDSPLFDIDSTSVFVEKFKNEYLDYIYVSNMTQIQGTVKELVSYNALREIHKCYRGPAITLPIIENLDKYKTLGIEIDSDLCRPEYRLTVDESLDYELIKNIYRVLYKGVPVDLHDVYKWLDDNPEIAKSNMSLVTKGINRYLSNIRDKNEYCIVNSGGEYVILDENKRMLTPERFLDELIKIFPELKSSF
jgi:spore coat polysaccharide biosynthesis protein SpsF